MTIASSESGDCSASTAVSFAFVLGAVDMRPHPLTDVESIEDI